MRVLIAVSFLLVSSVADAYVGPGLGLGLLGAILGGLGALLLAVLGIVWYPLKKLLRKHRGTQRSSERDASGEEREENSAPDGSDVKGG